MWEKFKNNLIFHLKNVQINLQTWKNAIEISRAYARPQKSGTFVKTILVPLAKIAGFVMVLGFLGIITVFIWKSHSKQHLVKHRETKRVEVVPLVKVVKPKKIADTPKVIVAPPEIAVITADSLQPLFEQPIIDSTGATPQYEKPVVKKYPFQPERDARSYLILVANKATHALYLLQQQNAVWRTVKEYDVAIGEEQGRKLTAGDRKTPEGIYHIVGRKESSELERKYGPLAYVLNYPNEEDRKERRTGQGIWIHGTDPDSLPLSTLGCLKLKNSAIVDLSQYINKGIGTPVVIVFNKDLIDPTTVPDYALCDHRRTVYLQEQHQVEEHFVQLLQEWKTAWETKNIITYANYYDTTNFSGQGLAWNGWRERKLRTFTLYDTIAITIDRVLITDFTEKSAIVKFLQLYETEKNRVENGKKLTLVKENDSWKITRESTCPKEELLL